MVDLIELIKVAAASAGGAPCIALFAVLAWACGVKQVVFLGAEHVEMRATARRMRSLGASDKEVRKYLADNSMARAGRSP